MNDELKAIASEAAVDLYLDHHWDVVSEENLQSHRYRLEQFCQVVQEQLNFQTSMLPSGETQEVSS